MAGWVDGQLDSDFFARDTKKVARDLLGCELVANTGKEVAAGRIVEVEAYVGPHDPAAHGFGNRRTARNEGLFGPPGSSYVYFIYGMHWCFNAVTESEGYPAAVLVRALEPRKGIEIMESRRGTRKRRLLCSGPARLCQALGITGAMNGMSLLDGPVRILRPTANVPSDIVCGPRIGISKAKDWPLRFVVSGSPWLSRPA